MNTGLTYIRCNEIHNRLKTSNAIQSCRNRLKACTIIIVVIIIIIAFTIIYKAKSITHLDQIIKIKIISQPDWS